MRNAGLSWKRLGYQAIRALPLALVASCGSLQPSSVALPTAEPRSLSNTLFVVPTLHGETLSGTDRFASCTPGGGYVVATGTAKGPYPGTFSSNVRWGEYAPRLYSVHATFAISSGQYRVSGSMSGPSTVYLGICVVIARPTYSAVITKGGITLGHVTGVASVSFTSRSLGAFRAAF